MYPILGKTGPCTAFVPSFAALIFLNSRGHIFSASAISSKTHSTPYAPIGAPGALYAATLLLLDTTSYPKVCAFGMSYGAKEQPAAPLIGEPGKAPACK